MHSSWTQVITMHVPKKVNWFLIFGEPEKKIYHHKGKHEDRGARLATMYFAPGQVFGLAIQKLNAHGVCAWQSYVLRAVHPGETAHQIHPAIRPAAECLIPFPGKAKAKLGAAYLELLNKMEIDPARVPELHREAAGYLLAGVMPDQLIRNYATGRLR